MISSRHHETEMREVMVCPFCGFRDPVLYKMQFHIESFHTPDSPFVVEEEKAEMMELIEGEDSGYVICTEETCREPVLRHEFQTHLDMHLAERVALTEPNDERSRSSGHSNSHNRVSGAETGGNSATALVRLKPSRSRSEKSPAPARPSSSSSKSKSRHSHSHSHASSNSNPHSQSHPQSHPHLNSQGSSSSKSHRQKHDKSIEGHSNHRKKTKSKKHGASELGPYAMEKQMPMELYQALLKGPPINHHLRFGPNGTLIEVATVANETLGLVPVIAKLCEKDEYVSHAWLCDEAVRHVGKQMNKEGGFCGYRNIQMMISYIQGALDASAHPFQGMIPSIIRLQDQIERGWDMGINTHGRIETGGIKGTRKYIGTSEAETFFISLGLPCGVKHLAGDKERPPYEVLYDFVQRYFESGRSRENTDRILRTQKPPIYFQHSGHSMTIIGLEKYTNSARSLLVFDPSYSPCPGIRDLVGMKRIGSRANIRALLQLHRRGTPYLYKYPEFELLTTLPNNRQIPDMIDGFHIHEFLRSRCR